MYRYVMPEIDLYLKFPHHQAYIGGGSAAFCLHVTFKTIYKLFWFLAILHILLIIVL